VSARHVPELSVPGDKSITHRALILATLADGRSRIQGALTGADCRATARVLRALGGALPELEAGARLEIEGVGLHGLHDASAVLDCGNSGTTARLMMGVVAGARCTATFDGDASLRSRPMRRVTDPLQQMGAGIQELAEPGRLPLRIRGASLRPLEYASPLASAQVKSALLLAGVVAGVSVRVLEPQRTRDHSERMLRAVGVAVTEASATAGHQVTLEPPTALAPIDIVVPGDFSSAAFLLAAALIGVLPELRVRAVGVNPTRTGLLEILQHMGADVGLEHVRDQGGEPVADLSVRTTLLRGTRVEPDLVPRTIDELPILAVLAARAEGETEIHGAAELRVKESDRIRALVENLRNVGVQAEELPDGLIIQGTDQPLRGRVHTRLDHRIAMAFGVLAAQAGNQIQLDDPDIVAVSYPDFWNVLPRRAS
jgi:3-phosphoshikimate 1-carboxyvinyltransferase